MNPLGFGRYDRGGGDGCLQREEVPPCCLEEAVVEVVQAVDWHLRHDRGG